MKRKFLSCLMVLATILALMLTGCGSSTDSASDSSGEGLADGEYQVTFNTDSSMFHLNESCEGKALLTVKDGQMTVHITLVSKKIINLYEGSAEDAKKEGADLIEPTIDQVTYSDGYKEEVYGFDVPVPALDQDFNLAILGSKENWYDHTVSVSSPE